MKRYYTSTKKLSEEVNERKLLAMALAVSGIMKFLKDPDYMINIEDQLKKWSIMVNDPKYRRIVRRYAKWVEDIQ